MTKEELHEMINDLSLRIAEMESKLKTHKSFLEMLHEQLHKLEKEEINEQKN